MAQEYLGAIKLFAGSFVIKGYSYANGALMSLAQNTALFALYGTTYGGDGIQTFQLPDLRSRVPIGQGNGQGLTPRVIGELSGSENVTLLTPTVPPHNHVFNAATTQTNTPTASSSVLLGALGTADGVFYVPAAATGPIEVLAPTALSMAGGSQPHNNIMPSMGINFLVALVGVFPSRS